MIKKNFVLLLILLLSGSSVLLSQTRACKSVHSGTFKIVNKETGTTLIKRSKKIQIEKNEDLGYELILDIKWIDDCTYELRPKKLIKGDPAIMGSGKEVLRTKIRNVSKNTYIAETILSNSDITIELVVEILH